MISSFLNKVHHFLYTVSGKSASTIIDQTITFFSKDLGIPDVAIALWDEKTGEFVAYGTNNSLKGVSIGMRIPRENLIHSKVLSSKKPLYRPDLLSSAHIFPMDHEMIANGMKSDFLVPLMCGDDFTGVLSVGARKKDGIQKELRFIVNSFAPLLTLALNNTRLSDRLEEEKERYKSLVDNAHTMILRVNGQGIITFVNEYAIEFFGFSYDEFVGRTLLETIVPPFDSEGVDLHEMVYQCFIDPEKFGNSENENICKDGRRVWVSWSNKALFDTNGNLLEIITFGNDITRVKESKRQLEKQERVLKEAQAIAKVGNWELDLVQNKLTWSDEVYKICGIPPRSIEPSYEAFLGFVHPDDLEWVNQAYHDHISRDVAYDIVHRIITAKGDVVYMHEKCETTRDSNGNAIRSLGVVADVTSETTIRRKLEISDRRFRRALNMAKLAYWRWEVEADDWEFCENMRDLFKVEGEKEASKGALYALIAEINVPTFELAIQEARHKGHAHPIQLEVIVADKVKHVVVRIQQIKDVDGSSEVLFGTIQDFTEQKRIEIELEDYKNELEKRVDERTTQLTESEEKYRKLVESTTLGVGITYEERVFYANPGLLHIFGYDTLEEFAQKTIFEHTSDEGKAFLQERYERVRRGEDVPQEFSIEYVKKDGSPVICSVSVTDVMIGDKKCRQASFTDISELKRKERMLMDSEEKFRSLAEHAPNFILQVDRDCTITYSNFEIKSIYVDQASKHTWLNLIKAGYRDQIIEKLQRVFEQAKPDEYVVEGYDNQGNVRWFHVKLGPILRDGNVAEAIAIISDITRLKSKERDLQESEERWKSLVKNTPELIMLINDKGIVEYANRSFNGSSIVGLDWKILMHQSYHFQAKTFLRNVLEKKSTVRFDAMGLLIDGEIGWFDIRLGPTVTPDGEIKVVAILSDITELKRIADTLELKNRELNEFAYVVSHDLKAPLRGINSLVHWIKEDLGEQGETVRTNLDLLLGRIKRLDGFINGLLNYSRIGRESLKLENVDTFELVKEIVKSTINGAENVEVTISPKLPIILNYRLLLQQVFSNLIANAMMHNDKSAINIEIYYKPKEGIHCFEVKDNGPGIPQEHVDRIFQIFQTLESKDDKESTGVGLAIVKKILVEMKGSVSVRNRMEGGSSFRFCIPMTWS